jgi:multiple sugar transport system permease protein
MGSTQLTARRKRLLRLSLAQREATEGYLYISPWIVGFLVFTLGPMLASGYLSLTEYSLLKPPEYIGLRNFGHILHDPVFWKSLGNTYYYVAITVPVGVTGALCCALLLNQKIIGRAFFRTVYFLPSVTPVVAMTMVWIWVLNPQVGLVNYLLSLVGIRGPLWLGSTQWSKPALIIMDLWSSVGGGTMLIFLAGLQGIPVELQEAAEIDGAGSWSKLWRVTLPLLTPSIFLNLILGIIGTLQVFSTAYVVSSGQNTVGGPSDSTLFYVLNLYRHAFIFYEMGYASALAWVFFIMVMVFTLAQFRLSRTWVYYEAGGGGTV